MNRRRSLSDEDHAIWTGFARSITPLRRTRPPAEPTDSGETRADKSRPAAHPPVRLESAPAKKSPPLAPLDRRLKQRVARGREPIEARLDLHGFTQKEAYAELRRFLHRAQADGVRTALIVTGKGNTRGARDAAAEPGILKRVVPQWLSLPEFRPFVVGFDDAHVGHGGAGALYVRLRRPR